MRAATERFDSQRLFWFDGLARGAVFITNALCSAATFITDVLCSTAAALCSLLACAANAADAARIFDHFRGPPGPFRNAWVVAVFTGQSPAALAAAPWALAHLREHAEVLCDSDAREEVAARSAIALAASSDWPGALDRFRRSSAAVQSRRKCSRSST
jgi:hypothetical protein